MCKWDDIILGIIEGFLDILLNESYKKGIWTKGMFWNYHDAYILPNYVSHRSVSLLNWLFDYVWL